MDRYGHLYPSSLEKVAATLDRIHDTGDADLVGDDGADEWEFIRSRIA